MAILNSADHAHDMFYLDWCQEHNEQLCILVLQPGSQLRRTLVRNLIRARYRVIAVEHEEQIRALVQREVPDLVIIAPTSEEGATAQRRNTRHLPPALEPLILVINRPDTLRQSTLEAGDLALDLHTRQARRNEDDLRLSPKEFDLLAELMLHPGQVLTRDALIHHVWGQNTPASSRTLDVHIRWLREKIEADPSRPERIQTILGVGYRFAG